MMIQEIAIAGGFVALQVVFTKVETRVEARWHKRPHTGKVAVVVAACCHPAVVKGVHDFAIYLVAEGPKLVGG